jgi:hypothetical protein
MNTVIDSLVEFIGGKDDELRDIAGLGQLGDTLIPSRYSNFDQASRL